MKLTPARRKALYRITEAALALATVYGLIQAEFVALWLVLVAAVLELAVQNVPVED